MDHPDQTYDAFGQPVGGDPQQTGDMVVSTQDWTWPAGWDPTGNPVDHDDTAPYYGDLSFDDGYGVPPEFDMGTPRLPEAFADSTGEAPESTPHPQNPTSRSRKLDYHDPALSPKQRANLREYERRKAEKEGRDPAPWALIRPRTKLEPGDPGLSEKQLKKLRQTERDRARREGRDPAPWALLRTKPTKGRVIGPQGGPGGSDPGPAGTPYQAPPLPPGFEPEHRAVPGWSPGAAHRAEGTASRAAPFVYYDGDGVAHYLAMGTPAPVSPYLAPGDVPPVPLPPLPDPTAGTAAYAALSCTRSPQRTHRPLALPDQPRRQQHHAPRPPSR